MRAFHGKAFIMREQAVAGYDSRRPVQDHCGRLTTVSIRPTVALRQIITQ
jgi:hypothetical protein